MFKLGGGCRVTFLQEQQQPGYATVICLSADMCYMMTCVFKVTSQWIKSNLAVTQCLIALSKKRKKGLFEECILRNKGTCKD